MVINRETANVIACWNVCKLLQHCSLQSHRIVIDSSSASAERTGTIPRTNFWLTQVTSLASDQSADHIQGSEAHIQGTGSSTANLPCWSHRRPHTVLNTAFQRRGFTHRMIVPTVQEAIRRQGIPCRWSSDVERPANSHAVGHYWKQLPETTKTHVFDIAYN